MRHEGVETRINKKKRQEQARENFFNDRMIRKYPIDRDYYSEIIESIITKVHGQGPLTLIYMYIHITIVQRIASLENVRCARILAEVQ